MTKKQINRLVQNVLKAMKDESKWKRTWKSASPRNFKTWREYNWINQILLKAAAGKYGYQENAWLTANQSNELWLKFRKWIKRIPVVYYWKTTIEIEDNNGEELEEEKWFSKVYKVANIKHFQWEIKNNKELNIKNKWLKTNNETLDLLDNYLKRENIGKISWKPSYLISKNKIRIPGKSRFNTVKDYEKVLTHECVHSTGSKDRLNRNFFGSFGTKEYWIEELIAEFWSCILNGAGKNGFIYISNRAKLIEKEQLEDKLIYAIRKAQKAIDYLEG